MIFTRRHRPGYGGESSLLFPIRRSLPLVIMAGLFLAPAPAAETPTVPFRGVPRFHQVNEHIYRGALPSPEGLQGLARMGVLTVLDLQSDSEIKPSEEKTVADLGMRYIKVPMSGLRAPNVEQVERALAVLQDPASWPVFLHCRHGVDRTGTVVACYRIQAEAWTNDKARLEAEQLGMHRMERGMRRFIVQFHPIQARPALLP